MTAAIDWAVASCAIEAMGGAKHAGARVYVAGAMAEIGRALDAIRAVREFIGPDAIVHDWTAEVLAARAAGVADETLSHAKRAEIAETNLEAIAGAGIVWLLASRLGVDSWVELGIALGLRAAREQARPRIVVSGPAAIRSINTDLADTFGVSDTSAMIEVARWARSRA